MSLHVVSDPHGNRVELELALTEAGLLDGDAAWSGGDAALWFLGDFFDRGPDGVGIVELVMRLQGEAAAAGGHVGAVLGNHEVLAVGMHRFGDEHVPDDDASFARSWLLNGGNADDQRRLSTEHIAWLATLPAVAVVDDWLMVHSDTDEYLGWGDTADEVNAHVSAALSGDLAVHWDVWRGMTDRYAFVDDTAVVREVLGTFGGSRVVHGHSIIATLTGGEPEETTGPLTYADGLALAVDGGLYAGGPLLVVRLDGR